MRRDELMKPDLLSEILVVGSGIAVVLTLMTLLMAILTRSAAT